MSALKWKRRAGDGRSNVGAEYEAVDNGLHFLIRKEWYADGPSLFDWRLYISRADDGRSLHTNERNTLAAAKRVAEGFNEGFDR